MEVSGQLRPFFLRQMNTTNQRTVGWLCSRVVLDALAKRNLSCPCRHSIPWPSCRGLVTTSAEVLPAPPRPTFTEHKSHSPRHRRLQYLSDASYSLQKTKLSYFRVHPRVCGLLNQLPRPYTISPCQVTTNKINISSSKAIQVSTFPHKIDHHCYPVCEIWYGDSAQT